MPARTFILIKPPRRCRPKSMISAPAIGVSKFRFCCRKPPTALADAPKPIKTTEKPTTKESAEEKRPAFGLLALAELFHADSGKHGDVAGNERKNAGREKRDQPGEKSAG